jgi:hypothetical protein
MAVLLDQLRNRVCSLSPRSMVTCTPRLRPARSEKRSLHGVVFQFFFRRPHLAVATAPQHQDEDRATPP